MPTDDAGRPRSDLPPYDSSLDLGGLPGGDILFTDPTTSGAGEPSPTAAVPPTGATAYRTEPPRSVEPRPDVRAAPTTTVRGTPPGRRPVGTARRRRVKAAWPLVAVLFWVVPAGIHAIGGHSDFAPHQAQTSVAAAQGGSAETGGSVVDDTNMTIYRPHSLTAASQLVTMHVDAPSSGSYTITLNGYPIDTDVTTPRDYGVDFTTEPTDALIASSDSTATIRCEIRDGHRTLVAVGEAKGILDCVYDPAKLLE